MIEELLKYQEVDGKLRAIETYLATTEERKKMVEARKYLETVEENLVKLENRSNELLNIFNSLKASEKELKQEADDFDKTLETIESEEEVTFLLKKADDLSNKIKSVEDDAIKAENEMKSILKEYASLRQSTKTAQETYQTNREICIKQKAEKAEETSKINDQLNEMAKGIDADLLALYQKKRKEEKMYPVIYQVNDGYCGRCGMELPSATLSRLKGGELIECDQCRRLIYYKG